MVMVTVTTELPYPSQASKDGADAVGAIDADRPANDLDSDAAGRGIREEDRLLKHLLSSPVHKRKSPKDPKPAYRTSLPIKLSRLAPPPNQPTVPLLKLSKPTWPTGACGAATSTGRGSAEVAWASGRRRRRRALGERERTCSVIGGLR